MAPTLTPKTKPAAVKPGEAKEPAEEAKGDEADEAPEPTAAETPAEEKGAAPVKKAVKKARGKKGTVFTMAHPASWDMGDFFKALQKQKVRAVHDARPNPEAGPATEALRVAFSSDNIAYEREPALSSFYAKLLEQARGGSESSKPCILLDGRVGWRLQQHRRSINQYLKAKGLDVRHLLWSGEIDHEATATFAEEAKREAVQRPDPPKFPVPKLAVKAPNVMAPTSKASGISMVPTTKAIGIGGLTPPTSKAMGVTPPTSKAAPLTLPLKPTVKASASFSSADASPKAADTLIKAKPKPSAPPPAEEPLMKPKPKGGGTPAAKPEEEPDAKKQKTEEAKAEPKQATITKKWAKKADAS
ncbi:unnamed protein product [Prorocentrum cordatum]|uniref:Uncharacterized protein n=1 Tax=Prorocentrum cordatum TaxID=2364126 RepID=A0ABN9WCE0_9DINO|nr:unnamed protein product [Polarella glacialis]